MQTDYEGEGTPGLHPYFAGRSGAHDVIDVVRAARHIDPSLSDRWFAMGHSEGGSVALFVAATANSWAPELKFLGAVAYAPGSDIPDFFGRMTVSREPTAELPLLGMMIEGIASTDPRVDLKDVLSPKGLALLPLLQTDCIDPLDVYKRQRQRSMCCYRVGMDTLAGDAGAARSVGGQSPRNERTAEPGTPRAGEVPGRQTDPVGVRCAATFILAWKHPTNIMSCLLYTSRCV